MQHVESESASRADGLQSTKYAPTTVEAPQGIAMADDTIPSGPSEPIIYVPSKGQKQAAAAAAEAEAVTEVEALEQPAGTTSIDRNVLPQGLEAAEKSALDHLREVRKRASDGKRSKSRIVSGLNRVMAV